tara:strand:- start:122 stop:502 length:381 start_codon:yes stop_codon:yes gene_type:complete
VLFALFMMKFFWKRIGVEIMHKKFVFIILVFFIYLTGCQSIKDGLEGNKKTKSSEEFLIQKKNPLVLPPDYSKLPLPKNVSQEELKAENEFDLEKIIKKDSKTVKNNSVEKNSSLEKSVIEKIKDN